MKTLGKLTSYFFFFWKITNYTKAWKNEFPKKNRYIFIINQI